MRAREAPPSKDAFHGADVKTLLCSHALMKDTAPRDDIVRARSARDRLRRTARYARCAPTDDAVTRGRPSAIIGDAMRCAARRSNTGHTEVMIARVPATRPAAFESRTSPPRHLCAMRDACRARCHRLPVRTARLRTRVRASVSKFDARHARRGRRCGASACVTYAAAVQRQQR